MRSVDGKNYLTDVADTEQLLRLVQSIPSPKAEPLKQWLARVGYERIEETEDPELALDRAIETKSGKAIVTGKNAKRLKCPPTQSLQAKRGNPCAPSSSPGNPSSLGWRASKPLTITSKKQMPILSMFYGVLVYMYAYDNRKHHRPHVHVEFAEYAAVLAIDDGEVLEGELAADWTLSIQGLPPQKIDPLK
jgi:hypothetical protein